MEKYGFVYIWYDTKRKMYYIGCHWGTEDDGYICSSKRMRDNHRNRPYDFKRRLLESNIVNRKNLFEQEYKWLNLIKKEELGKKYYNIMVMPASHWSMKENNPLKGRQHSEETKRKVSETKRKSGFKHSEETKEKLRQANIVKKQSEDTVRKRAEKLKGHPNWNKTQSQEARLKIGLANKGKVTKEETKEKISNSLMGHVVSDETKKKQSDARKKNNTLLSIALRQVQCPHCNIIMAYANAKRYHYDRCKNNINKRKTLGV